MIQVFIKSALLKGRLNQPFGLIFEWIFSFMGMMQGKLSINTDKP